ncbi:MAG: FAD-binding oxidoreductase [Rhizobiales bacterium]|nr:FAD-binding oxidoreductase [Hyphomicrobiales bacterium]
MTHEIKKFETWYEATAERGAARPGLTKNAKCDVCIIGGGLAGLSAAQQLARAGKSVVLFEGKRLAWGASGRNGGFVSSGFALGAADLAARVGLDAAKALYKLSDEGSEFVRQSIARIDPSLKMGDGWIVALRHDDPPGAQKWAETMSRDFAHPVSLLTTEQTRLVLRSQRYYQSVRDASAFHIHPLRYALALARDAEQAGATLCEETPALSLSRDGALTIVKTSRGSVEAQHVVVCVSSLDRGILPRIGRAVLPVATYVAVTQPLHQDAILTGSAIADTRRAGDYYRVIDGGRILWGGRITTRVSEPSQLALRMKGDMLSVYPQLGDPGMDYAWGGLMGYALHKMPLIGKLEEGVWYATAFGGHGLNTTAMAGVLLARAIAEGDDEYRRFAPFAPCWAGGPFGRLGVQTSYWMMQLRDRIDETKSRKRQEARERA